VQDTPAGADRPGQARNGLPQGGLASLINGSEGPPETPRRADTMGLPRKRSPRASTSRRVAVWSALAIGGILPSVGCQVEYAGMTLPSGRYMHDDVQYFPSGPDFPWANTQAATQRARMRAMGIEPPPEAVGGVAPGFTDPTQINLRAGGRPVNVNVQPQIMPPGAIAPQPVPPGGGALPGAPVQRVPVPGTGPAATPPPPPPGEVPPPGNP
jgi:hypothetical protein